MNIFDGNPFQSVILLKAICHFYISHITPCLPPKIDHFTVLYSVTWPLNDSEAGGDLVLIKTSLSLLCRSSYSYAN